MTKSAFYPDEPKRPLLSAQWIGRLVRLGTLVGGAAFAVGYIVGTAHLAFYADTHWAAGLVRNPDGAFLSTYYLAGPVLGFGALFLLTILSA